MYQLFIYLQPGGDLIWLWQRQADGAVQQRGRADSLARLMLPATLQSDNAVLVLPTEWVLLQPVTLPKGAPASALPLLLEDQLFVDIDQQHWHDCTGRGTQRTLAMVDRGRLQQWRDQLLDQGLALRALIPDSWLLPDRADITLLQQGSRLLVRGPHQLGWALPVALAARLSRQLQHFPQAALQGFNLDDEQQQHWACSSDSIDPDTAGWLTARWQGDAGLLPADWQLQRGRPRPNWRRPLQLAAVVVLMALAWLWLDNAEQARALDRQQQQLTATLDSYPWLQPGPTLESQLLDQRLAQQQRARLNAQLQRIAGLLQRLPAGQLRRLQLENGQLQLHFKGLGKAHQQQLSTAAGALNYQLIWQQPGRRALLKEHADAE